MTESPDRAAGPPDGPTTRVTPGDPTAGTPDDGSALETAGRGAPRIRARETGAADD